MVLLFAVARERLVGASAAAAAAARGWHSFCALAHTSERLTFGKLRGAQRLRELVRVSPKNSDTPTT